MTKAIILERDEWEEFKREMRTEWKEELEKIKSEIREEPMRAKDVAKYLKCSLQTVYTNWTHLRHVVDGVPYWYPSEIEEYIKKK